MHSLESTGPFSRSRYPCAPSESPTRFLAFLPSLPRHPNTSRPRPRPLGRFATWTQQQKTSLSTLTVRRGVREIPADAGRTAALAIAGAADAAVGAAAAAVAGLTPGGSRPGDPADVTHGHAELGGAQGWLRVYMGNDATTATAATTAAASSAAAAAGTGRRGAVHATARKRHQRFLIAQTDPAATTAAALRQLALQLQAEAILG